MRRRWRLWYMFVLIFAFISYSIISGRIAEAKSVVREGEAIVTLRDFRVSPEVRQGEIFPVYADFSITKSIWKEATIFLHLTRPEDNKTLVNADFKPPVVVTKWTPGQVMKFGPVDMYCPDDLTPGAYNIKMGLCTVEGQGPERVFVREPYTNDDIKDFVVGHILVKEKAPEVVPEPLIISDFKDELDLYKWETRGSTIERVVVDKAEGKFAGKITFLKGGGFPAAILEHFFKRSHPRYSNWSYFDEVEFEMYQDPDEEGSTALKFPIKMQLKDKTKRRYKVPISPNPQKGKPVKISLQKAAGELELTQIANFTLFTSSLPEDKTAYLSYVKLIAKERAGRKGPFVKFEGLKLARDTIRPGEVLELEATFSISRKFLIDHDIFLHIFRSADGTGHINADTSPAIPTTKWEVNKPIKIGPIGVYIPEDSPPGKYDIRMGLLVARHTPRGARYVKVHKSPDGVVHVERPRSPVDYFRQPYVNYEEYGNWIVGSFEVVQE